MDYQVWTRSEYEDTYTKVDCGDLTAAKREIDKAVRAGREPILTQEVPYKLDIKVGEVDSEKKPHQPDKEKTQKTKGVLGEYETKKGKAQPDKGAGTEGDGDIRRGDETATSRLDKGSGDHSAGDRAGD